MLPSNLGPLLSFGRYFDDFDFYRFFRFSVFEHFFFLACNFLVSENRKFPDGGVFMRILIFTNDWPEYFDEFAPAGSGGLQNIVFYSTLEKKSAETRLP